MDVIRENKIREVIRDFEPISKEEQKKLSLEELSTYLTKERLYKYVNNIPVVDYDKQNTYYLSKLGLHANRVLLDHQRYRVIGDKRVDNGRAKLYCITHIGKFDYQIVAEAINDHAIPFAGDPETLYRTFDGAFLERNQVVYCNVYDKLDCYVGERSMIELLKHNNNGIIYPEGFWNLYSNLLVMPLFPGAVRMAIEGNADLIPVAVEKYGNSFFVNIGENIVVNPFSADDNRYIDFVKEQLRNNMAKLKFEIFMEVPEIYRRDLPEYSIAEREFRDRIFGEYLDKKGKPIFSMKTVEERRFKPKDPETGFFISSPDEAFDYMRKLNINSKNAFIFRNDLSLPLDIRDSFSTKYRECLENNSGAIESVNEVKKLIYK